MFLADYHTHCLPWSPDASSSLEDIAAGAYERGMSHLCVTNHVENCCQTPLYPDQFPPFHDFAGLKARFDSVAAKYAGLMDMRLGCEIGSPHYLPEEGRLVYSQPVYDFVIGSVHNLRDMPDFYFLTYPEDFEEFRPTVDKYLEENILMVRSGLCDVVGHIGYMQRYMARQGKGFDIMEFEDRLRELFTACIDSGTGIEVNCSGLSDTLRGFIPQPEALRLYRSMGGEIVTCGTDAHQRDRAGDGIREAYELLRQCGFKYVCLYREHRPEFVKL